MAVDGTIRAHRSSRLVLWLVAAIGAVALAACTSDASDASDDADESASVQAESLEDTKPIEGEVAAGDGDGEAGADDKIDPPADAEISITEELGPIVDATGEGLTGTELEQYLAERYRAYWQAFDRARRAPTDDPGADYPELFGLAAGEQLDVAIDELLSLYASGQAIREPDRPAVPGLDPTTNHRVRIESLDGGVAELVSCLVNDQVRYEVDGGAVVSETVLSVEARSTMAFADGTWKVIRSQATALDPGVSGCWLADEAEFPY